KDPATAGEAEQVWSQAIESAAGFARSAPQEPGFAREQARLAGNLGLFLAGRGPDRRTDAESRLRQAVALFEGCEKLSARDPDRAAAGPPLPEAARKKLADAYAGVALDLLRRLKAAGKLDPDWLATAAALAPLRERADFRAEFAAPPKPDPGR